MGGLVRVVVVVVARGRWTIWRREDKDNRGGTEWRENITKTARAERRVGEEALQKPGKTERENRLAKRAAGGARRLAVLLVAFF